MATIRISDVKTTVHGYENLFRDIASAYPEVKLTPEEVKQLTTLVPQPETSFVYTLHGIDACLANGWRRVLVDEHVYPRLTCEHSDIVSTDAKCQRLQDYIQNRIWLIPTSYAEPAVGAGAFQIEVANTTSATIDVTSADIKWTGEGKCPIRWDTGVALAELSPGSRIRARIHLEWGINRTHGSFSKYGPFYYRQLEYKGDLPHSYSVHPIIWELGLRCGSLNNPHEVTLRCWRVLREKLVRALAYIGEAKTGPPYSSPDLSVLLDPGERVRYQFNNETETLTKILAWYAYNADTSHPFVIAEDKHPDDTFRSVAIIHADHHRLIMAGARAAISDIETIIGLL